MQQHYNKQDLKKEKEYNTHFRHHTFIWPKVGKSMYREIKIVSNIIYEKKVIQLSRLTSLDFKCRFSEFVLLKEVYA